MASKRSGSKKERLDAYWRENVRLITILLAIWFLVSYLPAFLSPVLNNITILTGFPFGYYMGSQGSLVVFVLLIFFYAWRMNQLDSDYGLDTNED